MVHHLATNTRQTFAIAHSVRAYAARQATQWVATRRFFEGIHTHFLQHELFSRRGIAMEFIQHVAGIHIADFWCEDLNTEGHHLSNPRAWLTATLRMMIGASSGEHLASPQVIAAADRVITSVTLDESAFRHVFDRFMEHACGQIELGIADALGTANA